MKDTDTVKSLNTLTRFGLSFTGCLTFTWKIKLGNEQMTSQTTFRSHLKTYLYRKHFNNTL